MSNDPMSPGWPSIPNKKELMALIADRDNNPPVYVNKPTSTWVLDANDDDRKCIRERERLINRLTTRLDKPTRKMEQDFDQSC